MLLPRGVGLSRINRRTLSRILRASQWRENQYHRLILQSKEETLLINNDYSLLITWDKCSVFALRTVLTRFASFNNFAIALTDLVTSDLYLP